RPRREQTSRRLDPVDARHPDVHQDDVGLEAARELDRFEPVAGLAYDGQIGLTREDHPEPGPHELLVVGNQDANAHASWGRRARTTKPPPGRARLSSTPPTTA